MKDAVFYSQKTINLNGKIIDLAVPIVMGILNVTPDSFYDGGKYAQRSAIVAQVEKMIEEGATIIDIGGYSTRPHATEVTEKEELERVIPILQEIKKNFSKVFISIDTFRATVAKAAVEEGACLINDISGGTLDAGMFEMVSRLKVPYILMHLRGTPQTMMQLTDYENILLDIMDYFHQKIQQLHSLGVKDIIVDVGFGFAKTLTQNYELLQQLSYFQALNLPILAGISRKGMIWRKLEITPEEALNGTTVLNTIAIQQGASILRVHDVKQAMEVIKLLKG